MRFGSARIWETVWSADCESSSAFSWLPPAGSVGLDHLLDVRLDLVERLVQPGVVLLDLRLEVGEFLDLGVAGAVLDEIVIANRLGGRLLGLRGRAVGLDESGGRLRVARPGEIGCDGQDDRERDEGRHGDLQALGFVGGCHEKRLLTTGHAPGQRGPGPEGAPVGSPIMSHETPRTPIEGNFAEGRSPWRSPGRRRQRSYRL